MVMKKDEYRASEAGISERYYPLTGSAQMQFKRLGSYEHIAPWTITRFFLRPRGTVGLSAKIGGVAQKRRVSGQGVQMAEWNGAASSLTVNASGSGTLFGAAFESPTGIIIDNLSMRGSAGISLANLPVATCRQFNDYRPYDLVILQFGVNGVMASSTEEDMRQYIKQMKQVVEHIKSCYPGVSILLFSTPDRGDRKNDVVETMKNIDVMAAYQKQLAAECKVGFYSLFNAMGGKGSMGRMFDQELCYSDFTHVTKKGGHEVASKIFKSIVCGVDNYSRRKKIEKGGKK